MLTVSEQFKEAMVSPVRRFRAEADIQQDEYDASNYTIHSSEDAIQSIEIQRVGDNSKFFGYGICQRLNIKLVDLEDDIHPISKSEIKVRMGIYLSDGSVEYISYPTFYLTERNREEEEGYISLTAYDKLDEASLYTVSNLKLDPPYTVEDFVVACGDVLGLGVTLEGIAEDDYAFYLNYENGANFVGTENLRDALNFVAEATQTIFYIDYNDNLHFKRLDVYGDAIAEITPEDYFSLGHSDNRRLVKVSHVTELGDNVNSVARELIGTTQYIRNNPFWDLREDIDTIVENAISNVYGLTINQFDLSWRGFPLLEVGDKIDMRQVCIDGCVESAYVLDDVITFDGAYSQQTQWSYSGSDTETESAPTTIGDALNHTYAKVDKINRQISLYASEINTNKSNIASLVVATNAITAKVSEVEKSNSDALDSLSGEVDTIKKEVEMAITSDDLQISISEALENGVNRVETTTGYVFDADGLTISKTDSEISTQITEDGMTVSKNGDVLLTANNQGVAAQNLHATTYLTIGTNSRLEDFINADGEARTGCFWIGG